MHDIGHLAESDGPLRVPDAPQGQRDCFEEAEPAFSWSHPF